MEVDAAVRLGDAFHTYCGGLVRSACQDCGKPTESGLLRCTRCDIKHERNSIPFPAESEVGVRMTGDTGCSYAPSCLECPFERCRYDGGQRSIRTRERHRKVAALAEEGLRINDIARRANVSLRTVHRALKAEAVERASAVAT